MNSMPPNRLRLMPVEEPRKGVRRLRLVRVIGDLGPALAGTAPPHVSPQTPAPRPQR